MKRRRKFIDSFDWGRKYKISRFRENYKITKKLSNKKYSNIKLLLKLPNKSDIRENHGLNLVKQQRIGERKRGLGEKVASPCAGQG